MKYLPPLFLLLLFSSASCKKEKINVSSVYPTDNIGNIKGNTPNDNQWKSQSFSNSEMSLFDDLDTVSLSGTNLPVIYYYSPAFPNPFRYITAIGAGTEQPFLGDIVVKYLIVDRHLKPVEKNAFRYSVSNTIFFNAGNNISSGNYRLYYTYSALGHEHFFKTWGNIRKE